MANPQQELPAEHAILGLLSVEDGPGHGYDLAKYFSEGQPLAEVMRLEPGMLYHLLKKLEKTGWLSSTVEPQGSRPPRQVYRITDAGRAELDRWLREPVVRTREIRLEFLVKLFFARRVDRELAARLIKEQREIVDRLESSLASQLEKKTEAADQSADRLFSRMVLELRLAQTKAAAEWLARVSTLD
jgi:DNA-binding PadR family transcriptional regulator